MFAFLATAADREMCNVKRAEARAADANSPSVHTFPPSRLNLIFNSDVRDDDDDDEDVTDVKTKKTRGFVQV